MTLKINNIVYNVVGGKLNDGDNYIVNNDYDYVKTFCSVDLECIEDRNNGAIKIKPV